MRWPHQVGVIPQLADCYQPRGNIFAGLAGTNEGDGTTILAQVLSGMGGVGKSQLAAAHARNQWDTGAVDFLLWITATSRDSILTSYAQAAREIGERVPEAVEDAADWFIAWLHRTDRHWLVILDDLADPAALRRLWPDGLRGRTVVTTRRTDAALFARGRQRVPVGVFTPADAHAYLVAKLDAAPGSDRLPEAAELAADLGHLPLALAQAAAFILDHDDTCSGYRTRLSDRRRQLSELFPDDALADDYQSSVAATWSISLDAADRLAPAGLARPLLRLASVLDPNGFPIDLINTPAARDHLRGTRVSPVRAAPDLGRDEVTEQDSRDALANLSRLSLVDRFDASPSGGRALVRVHALVQRATLQHLYPSTVGTLVRVAADALTQVWPEIENDPQLGQTLRSNTAALRRPGVDTLWIPDAHPVLSRAGNSLGDAGLVAAAGNYWARMAREADHHLGSNHPKALASRHNLAYWRGQAGDPAGAADAYEQLLPDVLRVLGPDHPDALSARSNLARWRGTAGDPAGAATIYERLLVDRLRVLGPNHPDTLSTRGNLARWRGAAGDPAGAAAAYEQLLLDVLRVLGPDHPHTLTARDHLAHWKGKAGAPEDAAAAFEQLLPDMLRVLGPDHPHTLTTQGNLADSKGQAGDPDGAVTAFEKLLSDQLRVLGPDHIDTLTTRGHLARWRGEAGDPAVAITAYEQLLTDTLRVLGPGHPHTLVVRHNLARWRGRAGDPEAAAAAFEWLLRDMLRVLGPGHPDTLATRESLEFWRSEATID